MKYHYVPASGATEVDIDVEQILVDDVSVLGQEFRDHVCLVPSLVISIAEDHKIIQLPRWKTGEKALMRLAESITLIQISAKLVTIGWWPLTFHIYVTGKWISFSRSSVTFDLGQIYKKFVLGMYEQNPSRVFPEIMVTRSGVYWWTDWQPQNIKGI